MRSAVPREIHYLAADGIAGYAEGDVLICDDTGERSRVVRDGRGLVLEPWRPVGRPRTPRGRAGSRLEVRLSAEERSSVDAAAQADGVTAAEYVRRAVLMRLG